MKKKFTKWYSSEIMKQLDSGKNAEKIKVKLLLSKLKPLHASWLIELYNHFTSTAGKEIIPTTDPLELPVDSYRIFH